MQKGALQIALGLAIAVVLAEAMFWLRDGGAFPHLNTYVPDEALGVRLAPGAHARIRFNDNPVTSVRINAQGYRGPDLPPPVPREILVVGDSQVFGLGVDEQETFSAVLSELTQRQVVNAGVPTYGPGEYLAVARELVVARKSATIVFTINMVNDLFEANRANRDRHKVLDGWAVRIENAPASVMQFPARAWLLGGSHVVFAWRKWTQRDGALASEGTWKDAVPRTRDELIESYRAAEAKVNGASSPEERAAFAAKRDRAFAELRAARTRTAQSVLDGRFGELQALCKEHGCEPIVLILPIDVQVSAEEWKKYGQAPRDMSPTLVLTDAVIADAAARGLRTLDARAALTAAYPGLFLDGDIHLTPKGHRVVAGALADFVDKPRGGE